MIRIIMTTYMPDQARCDCAKRVVGSLAGHLRTSLDLSMPKESIAIHIADDGSPEEYLHQVIDCARYYGLPFFEEITHSVVPRIGIGGSLNEAMKFVNSDDLWLYITDDWELTDSLNLDIPIRLIRKYAYNYVRLGPIHPGLSCHILYSHETEYWLHLNHSENGYCFATRPFLANKGFWLTIGRFAENQDAYDTERNYAERVSNNRLVRLAYTGPLDSRYLWKHIGDVSPVGKIKP